MSKKVPLEFVGDLIDNIHDCDCDKIFFTKYDLIYKEHTIL